jgi:hypothetical protein
MSPCRPPFNHRLAAGLALCLALASPLTFAQPAAAQLA